MEGGKEGGKEGVSEGEGGREYPACLGKAMVDEVSRHNF